MPFQFNLSSLREMVGAAIFRHFCIFYDDMGHQSTNAEPKIPSYRFYMDSKDTNKEIAFIIIFFNSKLSRKLDVQHYRTDALQTFD